MNLLTARAVYCPRYLATSSKSPPTVPRPRTHRISLPHTPQSQRASSSWFSNASAFAAKVERSGLQSYAARRLRRCSVLAVAGASEITSLAETSLIPLEERLGDVPAAPGVYAIYDSGNDVQYIGISRKAYASVQTHLDDLPELTAAVKVCTVEKADKAVLQGAWKLWVEEYVAETGRIPAGNAPGETKWTRRAKKPVRPEIKLTSGKGIEDLTVPMEEIIDAVVNDNKVVAFIKGTRFSPECGFSHSVLTLLNETRVDYEVVNVLDETFNPGLRETIKNYSQWPTIPQVYCNGEFIGGADIITEMHESGELKSVLQAPK